MSMFALGLILILAGIVAVAAARQVAAAAGAPRAAVAAGGIAGLLLGAVLVLLSTAIYVEDHQGGLVIKKFGPDLDPSEIVATEGEKGPQAAVLPPGWHFGYLPLIYDLEAVENEIIPEGQLGIVKANDGRPLPEGEIYAPPWESANDMLDAEQFLSADGGHRGPQLTVLPPSEYRYNPRLFEIEQRPVLQVPVGEVAVVKANAGERYVPAEGEELVEVNKVPIVPRGYRGIWRDVLTPDAYYLHPNAYEVTRVRTTNRVYNYADDQAISVRTSDGFEFPVDVRVSVKISAESAPYVVARLQNPDADPEGDGYTVIEERVILPLTRAIFRNIAEDRNALQFVNQRSDVEREATEALRGELGGFEILTDGVFVADIRISDTEAGRELLATQTEREVALNQQATFAEKERAQQARAEAVRAEEEANQQIQQAQARSRVVIAEEDAKAAVAKAEGEAQAWREKIGALDGIDNFITLELARLAMERWEGSLPRVLVAGGGEGGQLEALIATMLQEAERRRQADGAAPAR